MAILTGTDTKEIVSPKKGDTYRCKNCGMELVITKDCHCNSSDHRLECCGQEMEKT